MRAAARPRRGSWSASTCRRERGVSGSWSGPDASASWSAFARLGERRAGVLQVGALPLEPAPQRLQGALTFARRRGERSGLLKVFLDASLELRDPALGRADGRFCRVHLGLRALDAGLLLAVPFRHG